MRRVIRFESIMYAQLILINLIFTLVFCKWAYLSPLSRSIDMLNLSGYKRITSGLCLEFEAYFQDEDEMSENTLEKIVEYC